MILWIFIVKLMWLKNGNLCPCTTLLWKFKVSCSLSRIILCPSIVISCFCVANYCSTIWSYTGHLPSPECVIISEVINSSIIGWKPPYSTLNNESDIISVDPHITQYTMYITDNYTGNIIVKENVTETQFTFNASRDGLCLMYQVSAWNAGGEGELSEPVQGSTPQGKDLLNWFWPRPLTSFNCCSLFLPLSQFPKILQSQQNLMML